jgi:hypothetical protein
MTRILAITALVLALSLASAALNPAEAQRYSPYCAEFSDGSGTDCSYPSLQSCLASVSGVGGFCNPNPRSRNNPPPPNFMQRLMQGTGPAFAPVPMAPPPDSGLASLSATRASGNLGQFCAMYSDGSNNCGFPSQQSCRAAVSGVGGTCIANPRLQQQPSRMSGLSMPSDTHWLPPPPPSH